MPVGPLGHLRYTRRDHEVLHSELVSGRGFPRVAGQHLAQLVDRGCENHRVADRLDHADRDSYVAGRLAALLRRAREADGLDDFAFLRIERERAALLDYVGGCERILKTPIPEVYSVTIRRLVVLYVCALPFALVGPAGPLSPVYAFLIAYPILTLEQIGAELQNPFVTRSLSHLDLEELCRTIEENVRAVSGTNTPTRVRHRTAREQFE